MLPLRLKPWSQTLSVHGYWFREPATLITGDYSPTTVLYSILKIQIKKPARRVRRAVRPKCPRTKGRPYKESKEPRT
mgnify:CR=1 FL=1